MIITFLSGRCQEKKVLVDTLSTDCIIQVFKIMKLYFSKFPIKMENKMADMSNFMKTDQSG